MKYFLKGKDLSNHQKELSLLNWRLDKRSNVDFLSFMDQLKQIQVRSLQVNPRAGVLGRVMQGCTELSGPEPAPV